MAAFRSTTALLAKLGMQQETPVWRSSTTIMALTMDTTTVSIMAITTLTALMRIGVGTGIGTRATTVAETA
jgi:hypothetical protein